MKKVILVQLHAVGMEHHGGKDLLVGAHYQVFPEFNNNFDSNALAIRPRLAGGGHRNVVAYLRRDEAKCLAKLFKEGLISYGMYLKPKEPSVKHRYRGRQQVVNVGFYASDGALPRIEAVLLPLKTHYKLLSN